VDFSDFSHNYLRPQENGNRTDVRWMKLTDGNGQGLAFEAAGRKLINVSCHPYTREDLEKSTHIHNLPLREKATVHIDWGQRGVGGDKPGQLRLMDKYKMPPRKKYAYSYLVREL
jgi:beta-galactosidase